MYEEGSLSHGHEDYSSDRQETNATVRPKCRGRPRLKSVQIDTPVLMTKVQEKLKDDSYESGRPSDRTDTIRLKLIRKAIYIPQIILRATQRPNAIKDLSGVDEIEKVYKNCFQEFLTMCAMKNICIDNKDGNAFKAFVSLKYPESKVKHLLKSKEDFELFDEVKKYIQKITVSNLFKIQNKAIWEV